MPITAEKLPFWTWLMKIEEFIQLGVKELRTPTRVTRVKIMRTGHKRDRGFTIREYFIF